MLAAFFREGLKNPESPDFSHAVRWRNNRRTRRFFTDNVLEASALAPSTVLESRTHPRFEEWDYLAKAQYLEITIFLSQYLLSSQGDRMAMARG